MPKSKLKTPDWILKGYGSKKEYEKAKGIKEKKKIGKTFKIRKCPECNSDDVGVALGEEEGRGDGEWECRKCGWKGKNIKEEELEEEEFIKLMEGK